MKLMVVSLQSSMMFPLLVTESIENTGPGSSVAQEKLKSILTTVVVSVVMGDNAIEISVPERIKFTAQLDPEHSCLSLTS
jgi:hypothetical protein